MDDSHFDEERRRLRAEMQQAIERIQATTERRLEAVDRAEELMKFAASGVPDLVANGEAPVVEASPPVPPSQLRQDLTGFVAGLTEQFSLADVEARFAGVPSRELRTCLAQMAKDGVVSIVEPGEAGQPTRYEVPEPDYAGVVADSGADSGAVEDRRPE